MSRLLLPNSSFDNIKMVIFDKDGTLIDIHHYWCSMIEFRAEAFVKSVIVSKKQKLYNELVDAMGIDLISKKMKPEGPVGIKPRGFIMDVALDVMQSHDDTYTKEKVFEVFKEVDEYSKTKLKNIVQALPDTKRVLEDLKEAGIQVSIATTDLTNRAELAMSALNLRDFFVDIVGADLIKNAKPSADLIEYILEKNGLNKEDVVVVGDSMADLGMATNASCSFIAVKTGLYSDEFIDKSNNIVNTLEELRVEV